MLFKLLNIHPTMENCIIFKHVHAKAKRFTHEAKCTSWETSVSSLFQFTSSGVVWKKKLWHVSDGYNHISIPGISFGGNAITSQIGIVNTLGSHFTSVFRSDNYNPAFKLLKKTIETLPLNLTSWLSEPYNSDFHVDELLVAL
jgi:hypothetical protein